MIDTTTSATMSAATANDLCARLQGVLDEKQAALIEARAAWTAAPPKHRREKRDRVRSLTLVVKGLVAEMKRQKCGDA